MNISTSMQRVMYAHLLAVSCAAVTFVFGNELWDFVVNGDKTFRFPLATLVLAWIMAFAASVLPYAGAMTLAVRRGIRSPYFFIGGAVLTAMAFLPLLACAYSPRHLVRLAPMLFIAGLAAGSACWLMLKSAHNEDTVPAI
ncbi:hypothetical protein SAMN05518865_101440 [Duganella sp. CF458]|uniref:hypothetical protein n=1 Tax=Duganella sp. CF458 TaxID=1884368 RepID=UPI0008E90092|nr:hypothetical protein [Duganella sp. CF458]SFF55206.1 hypothetical protein SAMN05518865_101440 [Duganella sp. CF458]